MSAKIYVPAEDSWDFFEDNRSSLKKQYIELASREVDISSDDLRAQQSKLTSDKVFKSAIYMTEDSGMPLLSVECAGVEVERMKVLSSFELHVQLEKLYNDYILFPDILDDSDDEPDVPEPSEADEAYMRECELDDATDDFLRVVFSPEEYEDMIEQYGDGDMQSTVLMAIVSTLYDVFGVKVDWPIVNTDANGNTIVSQFWEPVPVDDLIGGQEND